jgi:hypothetical protein
MAHAPSPVHFHDLQLREGEGWPRHLLDNTPTAPIHKLQLPIIAYGLTSKTFKCLDKRPNVACIMRLLRQMDRNPLRGLSGSHRIAAGVRDCLPLVCHPGREWGIVS